MRCNICGKDHDEGEPACEDCMDWMEQLDRRTARRHESMVIVAACLVGMALIVLLRLFGV